MDSKLKSFFTTPTTCRAPCRCWLHTAATSKTVVIDDDCGPIVFGRVIGTTELDDEDKFLWWLCEIIAPSGECTRWKHVRLSA
jgi:hypothetical protein